MSKENICHYHYKILTKADEILKIKDNSYENIDNLLYDVQSLANDIYNLAELAKEAGMSMENRLKEYKKGIEYLGFARINK